MQDGVTVALVQFLDALRIFEVLSSGDLEILIFIICDPFFFPFVHVWFRFEGFGMVDRC